MATPEAPEPRSGSDGEDPGLSVSSRSRTPLILRSAGSERREETREPAGDPLLIPASASSDRRPVNADRMEEDEDEEESSSEGTNAHRQRLRVQEVIYKPLG